MGREVVIDSQCRLRLLLFGIDLGDAAQEAGQLVILSFVSIISGLSDLCKMCC